MEKKEWEEGKGAKGGNRSYSRSEHSLYNLNHSHAVDTLETEVWQGFHQK